MTTSGSILFVAGARPNFVKIAPLLRAIKGRAGSPTAELIHTGQHYGFDMSEVFFEQLGIPQPDAHLQVGSASHGAQTAAIMAAFEGHLQQSAAPRGVVVVGDVNSTMACALVAVKMRIPVAHVEAGLRSFDRSMPEEINRLVTDAVSDLLLVSEPAGIENLRREGADERRLRYVGNVMIDSLVEQLPAARLLAMPAKLGIRPRGYAVVTLHRPSNVDEPKRLAELVEFVRQLSGQLDVVFPVHPRTLLKLDEASLREKLEATGRVHVTAPLGYREFIGLLESAAVVVTDSGGVQEETTYLNVSCITLRTSTERPVTVSDGTNTLVGEDLELAWKVFKHEITCAQRPRREIAGWDGRAAVRIVDMLLENWG